MSGEEIPRPERHDLFTPRELWDECQKLGLRPGEFLPHLYVAATHQRTPVETDVERRGKAFQTQHVFIVGVDTLLGTIVAYGMKGGKKSQPDLIGPYERPKDLTEVLDELGAGGLIRIKKKDEDTSPSAPQQTPPSDESPQQKISRLRRETRERYVADIKNIKRVRQDIVEEAKKRIPEYEIPERLEKLPPSESTTIRGRPSLRMQIMGRLRQSESGTINPNDLANIKIVPTLLLTMLTEETEAAEGEEIAPLYPEHAATAAALIDLLKHYARTPSRFRTALRQKGIEQVSVQLERSRDGAHKSEHFIIDLDSIVIPEKEG